MESSQPGFSRNMAIKLHPPRQLCIYAGESTRHFLTSAIHKPCQTLWESIGHIEPTFGEFIIQRVKEGKTQCPSNPALQPQGATCSFPKCKGMRLCTFVYGIPCPSLVPFRDTTEASPTLSRLSYTHIYFSFFFVSSRFYVDFYHRLCNFAAHNGLRVCLPYQILSSLSGGMSYSYLCMSNAQHSVRLISDVQ